MEWEGNQQVGAVPVLTPEGQSEWERIYGHKDIITYPGFWSKPENLHLNKGSDWLAFQRDIILIGLKIKLHYLL